MNEKLHYENGDPILRVEDMARSVRFYTEVLGFNNAPWGDETFTSVNRDNAGIYLCKGAQGLGGAWVWLGVSDVRLVREAIVAHDWPIRTDLTNHPWALELHVEDPDGNVLRFGSDPDPE